MSRPELVFGRTGRPLHADHPTAVRFPMSGKVMTPDGAGVNVGYSSSGWSEGTGLWVLLDSATDDWTRRYKVEECEPVEV